MKSDNAIKLHIIDIDHNEIILRTVVCHCPRVGDEIRTSEYSFYEVRKVVWVYDEPENPYERVNIGVLKIETDGE